MLGIIITGAARAVGWNYKEYWYITGGAGLNTSDLCEHSHRPIVLINTCMMTPSQNTRTRPDHVTVLTHTGAGRGGICWSQQIPRSPLGCFSAVMQSVCNERSAVIYPNPAKRILEPIWVSWSEERRDEWWNEIDWTNLTCYYMTWHDM